MIRITAAAAAGRKGATKKSATTARYHHRASKRRTTILWTTAAAALSSNSGSLFCHAFTSLQPWLVSSLQQQQQQQQQQRPTAFYSTITTAASRTTSIQPVVSVGRRQPTRFYNSYNDDDDNNQKSGLLSKVKNVAKSILPSSWFQSEKEKQLAIQRQKVKDEVSGGISEMLRDAPLPLRVMGRAIAPILTNVIVGMGQAITEQQATVEEIMQQTRICLLNDPSVEQLLGNSDSLQIGSPFSQSSSTTSINGNTQTKIQLALNIVGSNGVTGVAQVQATDQGVQSILLQAAGRTINVNVSGVVGGGNTLYGKGGGGKQSSMIKDDNIIEAEIIEKDTTTKFNK